MKVTWDSLRRGLGLTERNAQNTGTNQMTDTELAAELAPFTGLPQQVPFSGPYQLAPDNGITVSPVPVTLDSALEIRYEGLLAKSGANLITLHYGFGPGNWKNVSDVSMQKTPQGYWKAVVPVDREGRFSFCFRDGAGNWDNNFGKNWSFEIHGGNLRH